MNDNKPNFVAFTSKNIEQEELILSIKEGYECWNLKKMLFEEFVDKIKTKIPPINDNVLSNYIVTIKSDFGITEEQYNNCSWGLFIPDSLDDMYSNNFTEILFIINLYSPDFMYPWFYVSDFGIQKGNFKIPPTMLLNSQEKSKILGDSDFVNFIKKFFPLSKHSNWQLNRIEKWEKEDWRLYVACNLYKNLKEYDNGKSAFDWQKEAAEMCAILESLFTACDSQNGEVGYRLRKRVSVLLSSFFPDIEKDIKLLYNTRSSFIHGSFFNTIIKQTKKKQANVFLPDFNLLEKNKEYIRFALASYLFLHKLLQDDDKYKSDNVMSLLESAIIDIDLRGEIIKDIRPIIELLPRR